MKECFFGAKNCAKLTKAIKEKILENFQQLGNIAGKFVVAVQRNCWRTQYFTKIRKFEKTEGSDTAEISYTRLRNQLKSNPKSRNHERN
jgi:hypothetical protein